MHSLMLRNILHPVPEELTLIPIFLFVADLRLNVIEVSISHAVVDGKHVKLGI